jgi:hypothetical protein
MADKLEKEIVFKFKGDASGIKPEIEKHFLQYMT